MVMTADRLKPDRASWGVSIPATPRVIRYEQGDEICPQLVADEYHSGDRQDGKDKDSVPTHYRLERIR